MEDGNIKQI